MTRGGQQVPSEPYGDEALAFTKGLCLQQEVCLGLPDYFFSYHFSSFRWKWKSTGWIEWEILLDGSSSTARIILCR